MGAANCVKAMFLEYSHTAVFTFGETARAENAVVVMNAAAAQQCFFAVNK
jgi:hypothetical protein